MAEISLPNLPGQTFSAEIAYISPFLDSQRQAEIRLNVPNQNLILKPKMYAEVNLAAVSLEEKLAVPRSAIINSGTRQIVYVAGSDGTFLPREVITGLVGDNDYVEILGGLSDGENVVSRGQFLLDSESRLAEALGPHLHGHSQSQQSMDSHSDSGHSTSSSQPHDHAAQAEEPPLSGVYTCPMPEHFHVLQYGAGRCPECGMNLVPVEQTSNAEVYVCPMRECGIAQVLPGDCPHCGMKLTKLEREQSDDH